MAVDSSSRLTKGAFSLWGSRVFGNSRGSAAACERRGAPPGRPGWSAGRACRRSSIVPRNTRRRPTRPKSTTKASCRFEADDWSVDGRGIRESRHVGESRPDDFQFAVKARTGFSFYISTGGTLDEPVLTIIVMTPEAIYYIEPGTLSVIYKENTSYINKSR